MSTEEKLADLITRLRASGITRLRASGTANAPRNSDGIYMSICDEAASAISRLSAEVQELRAALEYIESYADERVEHHSRRGETELRLVFQDVGLKAKAALAPETKERS
jgi:hypothetical protein